MTEPMSPFGGTAVAAPPTEMTPPVEDLAGGADNRRKLILVGAVVGVLVLALAAYFLLFKGGSSGGANSLGPVPHAQPAAAGAANAGGSTGAGRGSAHHAKAVTLPRVAKQPAGTNPFKPLVTPPQTTTSGGSPAQGGSTGSTGSTGSAGSTGSTGSTGSNGSTNPGSTSGLPTTGGKPSGSQTGSPGTTKHRQPRPVTPAWIELDSVHGATATFTIGYSNGTARTFSKVGLQQTFAGKFVLVSIQDGYATVRFGDGTPFDVHPGAKNRQPV